MGFDSVNLEVLLKYESEVKKKFILQNSKDLCNLKLQGDELNQIRDKYILDSIELLEKAIDSNDTICPVCGYNHEKNILEIYQIRKKSFENNLNKLINKR